MGSGLRNPRTEDHGSVISGGASLTRYAASLTRHAARLNGALAGELSVLFSPPVPVSGYAQKKP